MGATNRSSTLFTNYETNKYSPVPRDRGGGLYPIYFEATIVSASAQNDTYDLFTIPANWAVAHFQATGNALGASAGSGVTAIVGDSGDTDRLMASTDMDVVNAVGHLAYAGVSYRPTADTIVEVAFPGAAPVVGKIFKGHAFLISPGG